MSSIHPASAESAVHDARQASRSGDTVRATQLWSRVLNLIADHPEAHLNLGQLALARGDTAAARRHLQSALDRHPDLAIAHAYLARAHIADGDTDAALQSLDAAIHYDASAWGARFEKARILESLGRTREAAISWSAALQAVPHQAFDQSHIRPTIEHARRAVELDRSRLRDFLEERIADACRDERPGHVARFRYCLDIVTGRRAFITAKPLMLPFPELPAILFFDRAQFDWATTVEQATDLIREEMLAAAGEDFEPYVQTRPGEPAGQFIDLDRNPGWSAYFLWKHGREVAEHIAACPHTASVMREVPQVRIRSRAPAVLFSRLQPGVHIPPHNGATNSRLTVHLPLVIPDDCALRVGDETRTWQMGELLIFDDTILHEAWNYSKSPRTVLIFDVWHPMLTPIERELVTRTVEGLVDYYEGANELGEL